MTTRAGGSASTDPSTATTDRARVQAEILRLRAEANRLKRNLAEAYAARLQASLGYVAKDGETGSSWFCTEAEQLLALAADDQVDLARLMFCHAPAQSHLAIGISQTPPEAYFRARAMRPAP